MSGKGVFGKVRKASYEKKILAESVVYMLSGSPP